MSTRTVTIFSGAVAASFSISTPPSAQPMSMILDSTGSTVMER